MSLWRVVFGPQPLETTIPGNPCVSPLVCLLLLLWLFVHSWCYVARGRWKSGLSKRSGLVTGAGSLSALCSSLNRPVPMFMGIPMMMHSDTPANREEGEGGV